MPRDDDPRGRRTCRTTRAYAVRSPHRDPSSVAGDGIDELLTGFLPRAKYNLRSEAPIRIALRPNDVNRAWIVEVSADPLVTARHTPGAVELDDVAVTFIGSAAELYLGLWNRGDELVSDDAAMLARWRELARVT